MKRTDKILNNLIIGNEYGKTQKTRFKAKCIAG